VSSDESSIKSLSKEEISNLYLKKSDEIDGKKVGVIDNKDDYDEFYEKVLNKTPSQIHAYWMKQIFLGRRVPPKRVSKNELKDELKKDKDSIGYSSDDLELKVIYESNE
jgi:hypothetical protein